MEAQFDKAGNVTLEHDIEGLDRHAAFFRPRPRTCLATLLKNLALTSSQVGSVEPEQGLLGSYAPANLRRTGQQCAAVVRAEQNSRPFPELATALRKSPPNFDPAPASHSRQVLQRAARAVGKIVGQHQDDLHAALLHLVQHIVQALQHALCSGGEAAVWKRKA